MRGPDRLILFDIDCTLIDTHGAGGRAILRAIRDTYGVEGGLDGYSFHGRTDPGIVIDLAMRWGAPEALVHERLGACLNKYVEYLRTEVAQGHIEVLPGVREVVTSLACEERVVLGLLTGNVALGARVKLAPTGLVDLFCVGAYGSDSPHRPDLPPIAVARAERLTGRRFQGKEIVVVGDTPADIHCGDALGVKTVAVATGRHSLADLAEHNPDHLFPNLSDWYRAVQAMLD